MSIFKYLQLQPVEPTDDGTVSTLDQFAQDEKIDLTHDTDGEELVASWDKMLKDPEYSSGDSTEKK
jgi:hypothetical protein